MEPQQEPAVDPSVRADIPPYLLRFAVPPVIAACVLSAIDLMAGMALLTCFVVMAVVLRCFLRVERFRLGTSCPEESELPFPDPPSHWSDSVDPTDDTDGPDHRCREGAGGCP